MLLPTDRHPGNLLQVLLSPLTEAHPADPDAAVTAATCELLQQTYTAAIERLTGGGSSGARGRGEGGGAEGGWDGADDSLVSEGSAEDLAPAGGSGSGWGSEAVPEGQRRQRPADAGLLEERRGTGGGGGCAGSKEQQGLVALGRRCLREVQGSLDDVVGLCTIKQASTGAAILYLLRHSVYCPA